ncbi:hypothetical protein SCOR_00970 [Sulfidibacter corallicola]
MHRPSFMGLGDRGSGLISWKFAGSGNEDIAASRDDGSLDREVIDRLLTGITKSSRQTSTGMDIFFRSPPSALKMDRSTLGPRLEPPPSKTANASNGSLRREHRVREPLGLPTRQATVVRFVTGSRGRVTGLMICRREDISLKSRQLELAFACGNPTGIEYRHSPFFLPESSRPFRNCLRIFCAPGLPPRSPLTSKKPPPCGSSLTKKSAHESRKDNAKKSLAQTDWVQVPVE